MSQQTLRPLQAIQLLIRFSVPFNTESDQAASNAAAQLAEPQCWGAYEVRRAKRYEDLRPDGSVWAKYEIFGTFDVQKLTERVMKRLEERALEQVPVGLDQAKGTAPSEQVRQEKAAEGVAK